MKRAMFFAALSLLALSISADDLLNCSTRALWGERGNTNQIVIRAPYIFAADGHGVSVYDASTPSLLHRATFLATSSPSLSLALSGTSLLVATTSGLQLYRVDGASLAPEGTAKEIALRVAGNDSYFATAGGELRLWRASGGQLLPLAHQPVNGPLDVVFDGNRLFVSDKGGLSIFDTSAGSLQFVSRLPVKANAIAVDGDRLYLAGGGDGVYAVDVSRLDHPRVIGSVGAGAMDATSIALSGNRIFVGSQGKNVVVLQTTESGVPAIIATFPEPSYAVAADSSFLATAGFAMDKYKLPTGAGSSLRLFDIAHSTTPKLVGEMLDYGGPVWGVATDGNFAYVADPPAIRVIDIRRPSSPREVASILTAESADHVRINGSMLIAYGRAEVHMIDISDPLHPRYLGVYHTQGIARGGASFSGPYLIEANRASGFHVLDITNPQQPVFMTGLINSTHGAWDNVVGIPGYAYGSIRWGVKVVDLTTNIHHATWNTIVPAADLHDLEIAGPNSRHGYLLLAFDYNRLRFFDLTDPLHPAEVSSVPLFDGGDVSVPDASDIAYAVSLDGRLARIDFSNLAQPRVTSVASGLMQPRSVAVAGDRVIVGDTYSLRILDDLSKAGVVPATPVLAVTRANRQLATVSWSGSEADRFEVATSNNETFDVGSSTIVESNALDLHPGGRTFVRVRALGSCAVSEWSNSVVLDPQSTSALAFVASGTHLFFSGDATSTFEVAVRNEGDSPANVSLTSSSAAITSQPVTIDPHSTASLTASFNPAAAGNQLEATLTIDGASTAPFSIRATRLMRTSSATISPAEILVVPGVGTAPGAAGTSWHSGLAILCRGGDPCHIELEYTAYDGSAHDVVALDLAGGEGTVLRDFVGTMLGRTNSSGFVVVRSDATPRISASAETYNVGSSGKYGQTITAQRINVSSSTRATAVLAGVAQNAAYRTNLGFVNAGVAPASASVEVRSRTGAVVATTTVSLARGGSFAVPLSALVSDFEGSVSVTAPGSFVAFASRIDQQTGDAIFEYAQRIDNSVKTQAIPTFAAVADPVGSGPGAGGSKWRTELELLNGSEPNHLSLTYVPTADPSAAKTADIDLGANEMLSVDDFFTSTISTDPALAASGTLRITATAPFSGWTNVYNDSASGRFGQLVPLVDPAKTTHGSGLRIRTLSANRTSDSEQFAQIFPIEESDDARTNVGVAEIAGDSISLRLNFYDSTGALVGMKDLSLGAFQSLRMNGILGDLSLRGIHDLRLEVRPVIGHGSIAAWASTIDAKTGDGAYRMAE